MSKNDMVMVPREMIQRAIDQLSVCSGPGPANRAQELRAMLNAPSQQHQGEPVAYAVFTDNGNIRIWSTNCAAVAIKVMREEGKQAVPLYAHSAPSATAEVERLRTELDLRTQEREKFLGWCRDARGESTKLRTQLAERDALLQEIRRKPGLFSGDFILRLDETLSASADPRPFRTPDCPDCACVQDGQCLCSPSKPSAEPSAPVIHPINMKTLMQAYEQVDHNAMLHGTSNWCAAMATALRGALQGEPSAPVEIDELPGFEKWWSEHGEFCRAGGGDYEKTFAWRAWEYRAALNRK